MYYVMGFYPEFSPKLSRFIAAIREAHDPTAFLVAPHVTLLFPTAHTIGETRLIAHIENALRDAGPFEIKFGGFSKSQDHWLFLDLKQGAEQIRSLYRAIYSGILAEERYEGFCPHLGLGLFLKPGALYDYRNPRDSDFDRERYEAVLEQARTLPLEREIFLAETFRMSTMPESVGEWTVGKRVAIPREARMTVVREFRLVRSTSV